VAQPTDPIYELQSHSSAKHKILKKHLQGYFPILLLGGFPRVLYLEGFAGAGEYSGGEDGSPIIAIRVAAERPDLIPRVRFVFIEKDQTRAALLQAKLDEEFQRLLGQIRVLHGSFDEELETALDVTKGSKIHVFANLDAWGADVPFDSLKRLGDIPGSEVMVTFMSDAFRHLASRKEPMPKIDRQFGSKAWRRVRELPPGQAKIAFLTQEYRATMNRAGFPFTLAFEMVDEGGRGYFLMFGTRSLKGVEQMKKAMWEADRVYGVRFRDPKDLSQAQLDLDRPDFAPLRTAILAQLEDGKVHTVEELRRFALLETVYRETHAMTVLKELKAEGLIGQEPKGRLVVASTVWLYVG
jgi:three-Cys-motif partner protein